MKYLVEKLCNPDGKNVFSGRVEFLWNELWLKITNVVELKYRQHFSGPWKPDRTSESKKWCGIWEFGMDLTKAIGDGARPSDLTHKTQTVSTKIMSLKNKRAAVKRRITNTLKKLDSTIEQYGL